jgi:hypothetical protein
LGYQSEPDHVVTDRDPPGASPISRTLGPP